MTSSKMKAVRTVAAGCVVAIMLAACAAPGSSESEDEANGSGEAGEEATSSDESTDDPIVVAAPMPLTGPLASDGAPMQQALELAIAEYNEQGGLLGRELVMRTCDVAGLEIDVVQACAERLLGEDPQVVITGYDNSGPTSTIEYGRADVPFLHAVTRFAAVEPVIDNPEQNSNVFQYDPSETHYGVDTAVQLPMLADELGFDLDSNRTVAVVSADFGYNSVAADQFKEDMEAQGFDVVVDELIPFGVEEWGPVISNITSADPGIISFWSLDPSDAARFMIQLRQAVDEAGLDSLVYMQYTPNIPDFLELAGESADGLLWSTVLGVSDVAVSQDELDDYSARFTEHFGEGPDSVYAFAVRDAFDIWAKAVEEAGCVTCYDEVNDAIRDSEHAGFAGNFDFAPLAEGQFARPGDELMPTIWSQVQNGEHVRILPVDLADGDVQSPPWLR